MHTAECAWSVARLTLGYTSAATRGTSAVLIVNIVSSHLDLLTFDLVVRSGAATRGTSTVLIVNIVSSHLDL